MKIDKYFPFAFIYFFINSLALPFGLTYTALLSPLFYYWVVTYRQKEILMPFFVCLAPFAIMHFIIGVDNRSYLISIFNYTAVYIFCQAFYTFLKASNDPERIFRRILIINFLLCIIAIPVYFSSYDGIVWMKQSLTGNIDDVKRLKLFTYEASYYAILFIPLFFFYLLQLVLKQNKMNSWLLLLMLLLPFLLSFSIGVIISSMIAITLTTIFYFKKLVVKKRFISLTAITLLFVALMLFTMFLFFPQSSIFSRVNNILLGIDTSGNGRTSDAFILAMKILEQKSLAWGIGAGQIKILGADIIRSYYLYDLDYNQIAIPNAVAETLTIFGYIGLFLRLLIEIVLFFYTKVWKNYYRLLLFLFIFLYQFTGSFITSTVEYVIWILAFTNTFPAFDVNRKRAATQTVVQ